MPTRQSDALVDNIKRNEVQRFNVLANFAHQMSDHSHWTMSHVQYPPTYTHGLTWLLGIALVIGA